MHRFRNLLLAATLVVSTAALAAGDYPIVKYGNEEIKLSEVLETWKTLFPGGNAPDFKTFDENIRQNVLRGMVSEKLLYKEALKAGYDKNPVVKKRMEEMQRQIVLQSYMEAKAKDLLTDEELKKVYDEKVKNSAGVEEVRARHILVKTEEEAKKIAEELKKGGDFEKIAREQSTDKGSGAQGGDLGWFTKDKMVAEFADAAFGLKKGAVSAPVKSGFGWHIIKLEDRRAVKPASFEESKEELRGEATEKAVDEYVSGLLKNAKVKYYDENGKELPFDATAKPSGDHAEHID
ncbi:MAG: peptidylprolyl isomerase [Alphaproteobacteria bacterium]|nr:peptidylprolyl isomerase [Alphaproteobacteria bacterium]